MLVLIGYLGCIIIMEFLVMNDVLWCVVMCCDGMGEIECIVCEVGMCIMYEDGLFKVLSG